MEDEIRYKRTFSPRLFYFDDWEAYERQAKVDSVYKLESKCWKPWQRDCRGFKAHICSFQGTLINFFWHEESLTDSISEEGEDQKQSTVWVCLWFHLNFRRSKDFICLWRAYFLIVELAKASLSLSLHFIVLICQNRTECWTCVCVLLKTWMSFKDGISCK